MTRTRPSWEKINRHARTTTRRRRRRARRRGRRARGRRRHFRHALRVIARAVVVADARTNADGTGDWGAWATNRQSAWRRRVIIVVAAHARRARARMISVHIYPTMRDDADDGGGGGGGANDAARADDAAAFRARYRHRAPVVFRGALGDGERASVAWRDCDAFIRTVCGEEGEEARCEALVAREASVFLKFLKCDCEVREMRVASAAREVFGGASSSTTKMYCRARVSARCAEVAGIDFIARVFDEDATLANSRVWFGRGGYVTPLHYDLCHGFLAQKVGRKTFTLFAPDDFRKLYPRRDRPEVSRVDYDAYASGDARQREKFPDFADAHAMVVTLEPGDVLYTPPFWWHHVRSMDDGDGDGNGVVVSVLVPFDLSPGEAKHMCHFV